MAQLTISQDIRPISDLKAKGSEIVSQATSTGRPVVLTRHGRGVAVVLAVDDYERLHMAAERSALLDALQEGQRDIDEGRIITHEEMRSKWLGEDADEAS